MLPSVTSSDLSPSPMTQHTRTDSSPSSTQSTAPWAEDVCVRPSAATDCLGSVASPLCPILFIYNRVQQIGKGKFCVHYGNGIRLESLSLRLSILNKNPRSIYMLRQQAQDVEKNKGEMPFAQVLFPNCSLSISIVIPSFLWELPKPPMLVSQTSAKLFSNIQGLYLLSWEAVIGNSTPAQLIETV